MHCVNAVLVSTIFYVKDEEEITVPKGSKILVDPTTNIALVFGQDHIDIDPKEWVQVLK